MNPWMLVTTMWMFGGGLQNGATTAPDWTVHTPRPVPSAILHQGSLSFDGRETISDFTGTTTTVRGEMTGGDDLTALRGWVEAPVVTLVTGNERRDAALNRSMESDKYPTLRFELTGVTPKAEQGDTALVELQVRSAFMAWSARWRSQQSWCLEQAPSDSTARQRST